MMNCQLDANAYVAQEYTDTKLVINAQLTVVPWI